MVRRATDNGAATLVLLETAPMGFNNIGWKYYLVIICWSAFFIPGKTDTQVLDGHPANA
jgi:hypothetical protein